MRWHGASSPVMTAVHRHSTGHCEGIDDTSYGRRGNMKALVTVGALGAHYRRPVPSSLCGGVISYIIGCFDGIVCFCQKNPKRELAVIIIMRRHRMLGAENKPISAAARPASEITAGHGAASALADHRSFLQVMSWHCHRVLPAEYFRATKRLNASRSAPLATKTSGGASLSRPA